VAYYLGIDGGGSKTDCAVGDDDSVLATAVAGASNIVRVGEAEARHSLHQAIGQACAAAGISPQEVARTCIGAAGASSEEVRTTIHRITAEILPAQILVTGDMQIALEAAFPEAPGIVVIAGTGSIVYGRDAKGNTARAGGWGFAVSDEGSAHWIGRNAVSAVLRAWDLLEEGCKTEDSLPLFRALQKSWNVNSVDALVRVSNATPGPNFAALLPSVLACADAGDTLSRDVLMRAGRELAQLAVYIIPRLFPQHLQPVSAASPDADARVPLAMVGGVFRHSGFVRDVFYNEVKKLEPRAELLARVVNPVDGALRLARLD
jgi:glucosamine kinase